jgi:hypothetical protein
MSNLLRPLDEPFPEDITDKLSVYPRIGGKLLSLFRTFANSARFLDKAVPNLLDDESPLPMRDREIVILRTCWQKGCEYEWGVHASVFGKLVGFTEVHLNDTCSKNLCSDLWVENELVLFSIVDALCEKGRLNESESKVFADNWSKEQQLEILALCGTYHTVSFVANVARLEPEPFAKEFSGSGPRID